MGNNGIEIRSGSEEAKEKKRPLAALLFLNVGVCGILSLLHSIKGISFSMWMVSIAAIALCWLIWYTYYGKRKLFFLLVLISILVCQVTIYRIGDTLMEQIVHSITCIIDGTTEPMPILETAMLFAVVISFLMAAVEFWIKSHFILYLLTTGLLLVSPIWGIRAGMQEILLLALFQITFWVMEIAERKYGKRGFHRKLYFGGIKKRSLSGKSGIAAGMILAALFLIVFPIAAASTEKLYGFVYDIEGKTYQMIHRLSGRADELITGGKIHGENNYRTGAAHLELEASIQPSEVLYLRGFGGGTYIGGNWIRSSDEALFANIMERSDWQNNQISIASRYYGMYFVMNSNMQRKEEERPQAVTLTVKHCNGVYGNAYVPYYSQRNGSWYHYNDVYEYGYASQREGYSYRYFEQKDMMIDWDNVSESFAWQRNWYQRLQEAYVEEIQSAYTQVPISLLPRLTELCQENPQKSLEEITAFILYTLHSNASYTLTPGWAPLNEDIVEYFLFEGGRGYCEHFAVTATLMYRLYGIPARYATGYMVEPSAFEQQGNGIWKAMVTDQSAHAWVEIFLEDYGWTPVEVTPATDGSSVASYPGFNNSVLGQVMRKRGWQMNRPNIAVSSIENGQERAIQDILSFDLKSTIKKYEKWFSRIRICFVYSLCLFPLFLDYRRLRKLKKMENQGCRKIFFRLLQMLHCAGILDGYDGTEEDFSKRLSELTGVDKEEIAEMQRIVCEAAYSFVAPAPEKEECVRRTYRHLAEAVYGKLNWHKKIMVRNIKAFI